MRSDAGKGPVSFLIVLDPDGDKYGDGDLEVMGHVNGTVISGRWNEDYSTGNWPLVVKIRPGTKNQAAAKALRDLAHALDTTGTSLDLDPEEEHHLRKAFEEAKEAAKKGVITGVDVWRPRRDSV